MAEDLSPLEFTLEPLPQAPTQAPARKASFQIDTRDHQHGDRRKGGERRQTIRFEADRRSGKDRRPVSAGWDKGIDI
ncbi:hypothetical protein AAFN46_12815 [Pseudomonas sp. CAU 1711]|uniref:hypothetical protein n=1 Tax=Pseudomonas sp. CAU 1711 TaxID=3140356 RepID=UPI0032606B1C